MKEKLEADLSRIADRILKREGNHTVHQLKEEVRVLYEQLTVLAHVESSFSNDLTSKDRLIQPAPKVNNAPSKLAGKNTAQSLGSSARDTVQEESLSQHSETQSEVPRSVSNAERIKKIEDIPTKPEFVIDEINANITEDLFVPASDKSASKNSAPSQSFFTSGKATNAGKDWIKNDISDIGTGSQDSNSLDSSKPKSLNDRLKKNLNIGLNDRIAFIKNLFNNSTSDYNRVISQLNTIQSHPEALQFIEQQIKPDYNQWEGKETYEKRFLDMVHAKFETD